MAGLSVRSAVDPCSACAATARGSGATTRDPSGSDPGTMVLSSSVRLESPRIGPRPTRDTSESTGWNFMDAILDGILAWLKTGNQVTIQVSSMEAAILAACMEEEPDSGVLEPKKHWLQSKVLGHWTLDPVRTDRVLKAIPVAHASNTPSELPASLYGVWWFRNRGAAGASLISFADTTLQDNTFLLPSYGPQCAYENTLQGIASWKAGFNNDFNIRIQLHPSENHIVTIELFPKENKLYTMECVTDRHWRITSTPEIDPAGIDFDLVRIVDANGHVDEQLMAAFVQEVNGRTGTDHFMIGSKRTYAQWMGFAK
ncbi:hypothetical protein BC830DRAFT_1086845 [Chytriomyces sp. MP71]|nr:hypothetical protein BC830DRAFT_1086845 [Chytriomyces sp. MP71]